MRIPLFKSSAIILLLTGIFVLSMGAHTQAQTSPSTTMTCIPVQQISQDKTQLECRFSSSENPYFLVSEIGFPFNITKLIKVSSSYSATLALPYPAKVVDDTIFIAAVGWGDAVVNPQIQAIPFDSLSVLLETDQSMRDVKVAVESQGANVSLLRPNPTDAMNPIFQTLSVDEVFLFDGSLILESFTGYLSPGVLQFLKLGLSCYEKTPQVCLQNMIKNL